MDTSATPNGFHQQIERSSHRDRPSAAAAADAAADARAAADGAAALLHLELVILHAAHLLPAQGPIPIFIHHNTLHAFEEMPFTEAVKHAGKLFGCQPYLSKEQYREALAQGRIGLADLQAVLSGDLGARGSEKIAGLGTSFDLRLAMVQYPLRYGPTPELLWLVAETDALRRVRPDIPGAVRGRLIDETRAWALRDLHGTRRGAPGEARQSANAGLPEFLERLSESHIEHWSEADWESFALQALWRVCRDGIRGVPDSMPPVSCPVRLRDLLLGATGVDSDLLVHDLLIRFCGAFLDQGLGHWQLPERDEGFYRSFCALYRQPCGPAEGWRRGLAREAARLQDERVSPLKSILESLGILGVAGTEWAEFLSATLLALRGWAGIIQFLEDRPDRAVHPVPQGSLIEFVAIRLVLERLALAHLARRTLGYTGPLSALRDELRTRIGPREPPSVEQRAFVVFQLAQTRGWTPQLLHGLSPADWIALLAEIESFPPVERLRIFHLAYERRFYAQALDAIALHAANAPAEPRTPAFQAMFCIDEREESLRRHVEELAPAAITYGIAGFYFVDMYYRGVADAHFVPLCPAVMKPGHWVVERVVEEVAEAHQRRSRTRRVLGRARHQFHIGTRAFALGALLSALVGVLASVPLIARTLFPRLTARLRQIFGRFALDPPPTELVLERTEPTAGPDNGHVGFTLDEMTNIAERVLRDTGLTSGFAPIVLMFGHGSTSMNNPHESAHDCGACGGGRGGPNARAIARILNDPRVRERLSRRGVVIPATTVFVGAMHNTSSEAFTFYDLERLPDSQRSEFEEIRALIEQAGDRDAHERCRRFESAPLTLSLAAARQHVEGRAEDLAQVRPEWGHATNAVTIVGRRHRTRGLFLDRRAFLNSYDPTQDDAEGKILERILRAAVPVCAGISLEYYFSFVDNVGYGCGTKLPHNIAALLGVMDGAASDLRTGLPWQMVEIHEPMRHLFVVETWPHIMRQVMDRNPAIERLIHNEWIRLALLDPESPAVKVYENRAFREYQPQTERLPRAGSSVDWYGGRREHLEFAEIGV